MLDLTADAEVDGAEVRRRRSVPRSTRTSSIDCDRRRSEAARRQDRGARPRRSARSSRRSGRRPAAARRWAATTTASSSSTQVRKACRIGKTAARARRPPVRRRPHRLGRRRRRLGARIPTGNTQADRRDVPRGRRRRRGPRRAPRRRGRDLLGRHALAGSDMVELLEDGRTARRRSASRPTWRTRCSSRSATTRPRTASCPKDYDWTDTAALDEAYQDDDRRAAPVDDRFPRRAERRHGQGLRLARQDRPPLPGRRSERQARHRHARRLLAARRRRQADQAHASTSAGTAACSRTR